MKTSLKRSPASRPARPAYRTLEGWALGTLIDHGAVTECEHHGHRKDLLDPDAWARAREEAWRHPFPGATPESCLKAPPSTARRLLRHGREAGAQLKLRSKPPDAV